MPSGNNGGAGSDELRKVLFAGTVALGLVVAAVIAVVNVHEAIGALKKRVEDQQAEATKLGARLLSTTNDLVQAQSSLDAAKANIVKLEQKVEALADSKGLEILERLSDSATRKEIEAAIAAAKALMDELTPGVASGSTIGRSIADLKRAVELLPDYRLGTGPLIPSTGTTRMIPISEDNQNGIDYSVTWPTPFPRKSGTAFACFVLNVGAGGRACIG